MATEGWEGWGVEMNELNKCKSDRVPCEDNKECGATNESGDGELSGTKREREEE